MPQKSLKISAEQFDLQIAGNDRSVRHLGGPRFETGRVATADCVEWLASISTSSVDMVFADPPYNIGKAAWDSFASHDGYVEWCLLWIKQCARVLKPTGSLFVCGYTEIVAEIVNRASMDFSSVKWLIWFYKNKANLGRDWGRSHESVVHLRHLGFRLDMDAARIPYGQHTLKYPSHPQALSSDFSRHSAKHVWTPHPLGAKAKDVLEIPTISNGMAEKTPHPTQKPEELLRRLMAAASSAGDLVIDPFSGSGTTVVVAEQLERRWAGCDLNEQYNRWAAHRLDNVQIRSEGYWLGRDRRTAERRESIR